MLAAALLRAWALGSWPVFIDEDGYTGCATRMAGLPVAEALLSAAQAPCFKTPLVLGAQALLIRLGADPLLAVTYGGPFLANVSLVWGPLRDGLQFQNDQLLAPPFAHFLANSQDFADMATTYVSPGLLLVSSAGVLLGVRRGWGSGYGYQEAASDLVARRWPGATVAYVLDTEHHVALGIRDGGSGTLQGAWVFDTPDRFVQAQVRPDFVVVDDARDSVARRRVDAVLDHSTALREVARFTRPASDLGVSILMRDEDVGDLGRRSVADAAALAGLLAIGLLALGPALGARFVLIDDHEILRFTLPGSPPPLSQLVAIVTQADLPAGRLRPVYWAVRLSEMAVFGSQPAAWHAFVLLLGLVTAGLLYATGRLLRAPVGLALLLGAWLLVAPGISANWVRLGTNETIGMPWFVGALLLAAMAAGARGRRRAIWDSGFVLAAVLAMLAKESFALAAPALAVFRMLAGRLQHEPTRLPVSAAVVALSGVVLTAGDFVIAATAGGQSYGGAFLNAPTPKVYASNLAHNLAILGFVTSGWVAMLLVVAVARRWLSVRERALATWGAAALALLVGPQLALYSRPGIIDGKYELPAALGMAIGLIGGLAWLVRRGQADLARLGGSVFGLAIGLWAFSTATYATYFADDSQELHRVVSQVAATAPPAAIVGIAGNPARDFEPMLSLIDHVAAAGRPDLQLKALPIEDPATDSDPRLAALTRTLLATPLGQPAPLSDCSRLSAVIVLHDPTAAQQTLPCLGNFQQFQLKEPVLLWGGDQVSLRPRLPGVTMVGYTLLQATSAAALQR